VASEEIENIRIGYKTAADLITTLGNQNWARFNSMLVANSLFFALLGQALVGHVLINWPLPLALPAVGLVLCLSWWAAVSRGLTYQDYYVARARELEAQLAPVNVLQLGHVLGQGGAVPIGEGRQLWMSGPGRIRTSRTMQTVIVLFVLLYVVAVGLMWWAHACS